VDVSQSQEQQGEVRDWDDEPASAPKPGGRRGYLRVAIRLALITVPFIAAAVLVGVAGNGGTANKQLYNGDSTAGAVMLQLPAKGPNADLIVSCTDAPQAAGAVSHCTASSASQLGSSLAFDVDYADAQGSFSFQLPASLGGAVIRGQYFQKGGLIAVA
jgi:hypothetical protein